MGCPHCESADTTERRERTARGYRRFRCQTCKREFNEGTGTRFNHLQYPTDVVCLVVLWRVRYKLSLRDLAEMFLERGYGESQERPMLAEEHAPLEREQEASSEPPDGAKHSLPPSGRV
jgi:putative transposase